MSVHDEFERSVGGGRRGLHPLAWLAIVFSIVAAAGFAVIVVGGLYVAKRVQRAVPHAVAEFKENPIQAVATRLLANHPRFEVVSADQGERTVVVRDTQNDRTSTMALEDVAKGRLTFETENGVVTIGLWGGDDGGRIVVTRDGEDVVSLDARGADGRGSLVVRTNDGEVLRLDAVGHEEGGSLTIRADGDEVLRFDAEGGAEEAWLRVSGPDGELMRLELQEGAGDGAVTLHTAGGSTTFKSLEEGGQIPRWVPGYRDIDEGPQVYTAETESGHGGAFKFSTDDSIDRVVDHFQGELEGDGFDVKNQRLEFNDAELQATLVAERDDRTVMVFAVRAGRHSDTHAFVTYWER